MLTVDVYARPTARNLRGSPPSPGPSCCRDRRWRALHQSASRAPACGVGQRLGGRPQPGVPARPGRSRRLVDSLRAGAAPRSRHPGARPGRLATRASPRHRRRAAVLHPRPTGSARCCRRAPTDSIASRSSIYGREGEARLARPPGRADAQSCGCSRAAGRSSPRTPTTLVRAPGVQAVEIDLLPLWGESPASAPRRRRNPRRRRPTATAGPIPTAAAALNRPATSLSRAIQRRSSLPRRRRLPLPPLDVGALEPSPAGGRGWPGSRLTHRRLSPGCRRTAAGPRRCEPARSDPPPPAG